MAMRAQISDSNLSGGIAGLPDEIDFDSGHRVINTLLEVLQRSFKSDMCYARPLMTPQSNIVFALDRDTAESMITYMTAKLTELGGFSEGEFRFIRKSGNSGEVLQRIRLDFINGVNAHIIRKLLIATDKLERTLPAYHS